METADTMEAKLQRVRELLTTYGQQMVESLLILLIGILVVNFIHKWMKRIIGKTPLKPAINATICRVIYILMFFFVVLTTARHAGLDNVNVLMGFKIFALAAVVLIVLIRPYIPSLPFAKGNTIKTGDWLGKVVSTSLTHTELKTFDGKTVFIPNTSVIKGNVINYHFTPSRRVEVR